MQRRAHPSPELQLSPQADCVIGNQEDYGGTRKPVQLIAHLQRTSPRGLAEFQVTCRRNLEGWWNPSPPCSREPIHHGQAPRCLQAREVTIKSPTRVPRTSKPKPLEALGEWASLTRVPMEPKAREPREAKSPARLSVTPRPEGEVSKQSAEDYEV